MSGPNVLLLDRARLGDISPAMIELLCYDGRILRRRIGSQRMVVFRMGVDRRGEHPYL
jgi:hypothetical protein